MENSGTNIRELRAEMNQELRALSRRVWELELAQIRMVGYACVALLVIIAVLILAGYG
jgi:uncharacterized RDD family membrane protein YckC